MRSALCLPCLLLSASALRLLTTPPAEYPWAGKNGGKLRTGASAFVAPRALEKGPAWSFHEADEMVDYHRISPLSQVNYPQFWGLIRATPLIDDKLNIYVSTVSEGRLYKFDPDGRQLWLYKDAPFVALPGISALLEGRLFAANTAGEAFALDMETGETLWKTKIAGAIAGDTWSMAAAEGVVIAPTIVNGTGGNNKRLVALNASVLTVVPKYKLVFNIIPKCAAMQFNYLMADLAGKPIEKDPFEGKTSPRRWGLSPKDLQQAKGWRWAIFIREPTARYLSAWGSKCQYGEDPKRTNVESAIGLRLKKR